MRSEAQEAVRQQAIAFAQEHLQGDEPREEFDRAGWQACARFGALGMTAPAEFGGRGQTLNEFVALMEGLGFATRRYGVLFAVSAQVFGAIEPIRLSGTAEQQRKYLPRLVSGEWVAAHGVTEPGGGSDISALTTTARRDGDGWVLNGAKHCITCGAVADLHIVYGFAEDGGRRNLSCFLVDPQTPGVHAQALHPVGLAGCGLGAVRYEEVRIPAGAVLGRPGAGAMLFQGAIERERACVWGFVLGAMERELEMAVQFANERKLGGTAIARHQAVAHRIADMKLRCELARLLVYHSTALKAAGKRAPLEAAMTKLFVSESFLQNSLDLLRVRGGSGFTREGGVEQFVRDALGGVLFSGTNDIQRNIIAACAGLSP